ncbi:MAG TPA: hypothetical protein VH092_04645 [Urbifossiella sp.]|nr:hypothetical protein [Urbifossiella sp.]
MPARLLTPVVAVALFAAAGCGPAKLDEKKSYEVDPRETKFVTLPAQPKPQRLTVEFESDEPIEIGVYKDDDIKDREAPLPTSKAFVVEKTKTSGTVTVDLGPDVSTTVTVTALGKKANVKLHMTNRK